ncbi:MAG: hypothetical protein KGL39_28935 [Patescibacteria group bacterium]|nr:hypothetical protein [Patescibacteria group bacterium]
MIRAAQAFQRTQATARDYSRDPVGYLREVLKADPWEVQEEISRLLLTPPYRVLVKASHSVGKTWLAAALTSWWYDTFSTDSAVITTAPTDRDVKDLLWSEVRRQRRAVGRLGDFTGSTGAEMRSSETHFAKGFTSERGESFQGRHLGHMLFVFDEAVGISPVFWETTNTMFRPDGSCGWLAIFNPTDTASEAYIQEQLTDREGKPAWHVVEMSALDHPNLKAHLEGRPAPYPSAVTVGQWESWLAEWADPFLPVERVATDLEWPPGSGKIYRPGPKLQARGLGRWPSQGSAGQWSDALWEVVTREQSWDPNPAILPTIGVDLAFEGEDFTEIHWRWGKRSLGHERHNGWLEDQTAGRLKQLCRELAIMVSLSRPEGSAPVKPESIPVHFDQDGRGGGLITHRGEYRFIGIRASWAANRSDNYHNRRAELWGNVVERARRGEVDFSGLSRDILAHLKRQLMSPKYKLDSAGRTEIEKKVDTKKRLKASPDGADAVNLCYAESPRVPDAPQETQARRAPGYDRLIERLTGRRDGRGSRQNGRGDRLARGW